MTERLLGMETEYGLSVILNSGALADTQHAADELLTLAEKIPHVPAMMSSGLFLANGSRFYVDCGTHPELATPECANPWDVCRYLQAGDRMLLNLAEQMTHADRRIARTLILKGNVDYTARTSWGCHESYLHRPIAQGVLARQIIPHLASRLIYSGAGGFDCFSPGIDFMVSPRVAHLNSAITGSSTSEGRGIFNTRNEPLCGNGYSRLHVLCGESLCGETGAWLKVSTTALVVALIEAGKQPGTAVEFRDPLAAMRTFATDPSCSRAVALVNDREATAIEVQRHFLEQAEAHAGAVFMPPWAGEVCRQWRAMLDRLSAPHSLARTLDWAIKFALFQNHARRRNTTLEALAKWSPILAKLAATIGQTDDGPRPLTAALVLAPKGPAVELRKSLAPMLRERGLEWGGLESVLALRLELFEIDTRYGLLGEGGLFASLDRSGVLEHRFAGVDNIPHALENPPAIGRAAIRGACIRRVSGQKGKFAAEWDGVWDTGDGNHLDLTDPFCRSEKWGPHHLEPRVRELPERFFREGRYLELIEQISPHSGFSHDDTVLSYARLGRRDEALALLQSQPADEDDFRRLALLMWIHCNGFAPDVEAIEPLITEGDRLMETEQGRDDEYSRFVFLCHKALFFMHRGLDSLAEPLFTTLLGDPVNVFRSRMFARTQCHLAELHRKLGRRDAALELVAAASLTHRAERLVGDSAAHSLPMLAKLATDATLAGGFLDRAEATHRLQRNDLGLAHILCLRARRQRNSLHRAVIERLILTVPVLTRCKVARRIVSEWDLWIAPDADDERIDYWGL